MNERTYQAQIIKEIQSANGLVLNKWGNVREGSGWPDLYVPSRIWHGWLELKVGKNKCSAIQKIVIRQLVEREVNVHVLRWKDGVETFEDEDGEVLQVRRSEGGKWLLLELNRLDE